MVVKHIELRNVEDTYCLQVGDHIFNFFKDVDNNEYEVINIKYFFFSVDDDEHDADGRMHRFDFVEVNREDYNNEDKFLSSVWDFSAGRSIIITFKNVNTGEIFTIEECDNETNEFIYWSSKFEEDAFELTYYKY